MNSSAEERILALKVCDPAVGSGHFLIAAAHRIARKLAAVRTQEEEAAPDAVRHALRDVIGRCVFGVDINPMAVELCQVALWMEAMEPGKPLSFLKHHVQCGNSLLGATPALLAKGFPDEAFEPIEGDDKAYCRKWKKINKQEREDRRKGERSLEELLPRLGNFAAEMAAFDTLPDDTPDQVRAKAERFERLMGESSYRTSGRFLADVWCAAFVWRKTEAFAYPITERIFRQVEKSPHDVTPWMVAEIVRLREQYQFFHWQTAFPGVFRPPVKGEGAENELTGWCGGFDVVLGNPPWERIKLQEQEWFAAHGRTDIAGARTASIRGQMIKELATSDAAVHRAFLDDRRAAEGESHIVRQSGRYPLCGRGDVNTYSLFAELNRNLISPTGRVGCILPSGIATDDTTKLFFQDLMQTCSLVSLYSFFEIRMLFPDTDSRNPFCLLTLTAPAQPAVQGAVFVFNAHSIEDLHNPERRFTLSQQEVSLLSPNTRTCCAFRTRRDAELTKSIYRRMPVLMRVGPPEANPWEIKLGTMFHMTNDSHLFQTRQELEGRGLQLTGNVFAKEGERYLPLYEGRLGQQFNHRFACQPDGELVEVNEERLKIPSFVVEPQYWVHEREVERWLGRRQFQCSTSMLGLRRVARGNDERTCIASILPFGACSYGWILAMGPPARHLLILCAALNSFAFDYLLRSVLSQASVPQGTLEQIACPSLATIGEEIQGFITSRVLELTYTAWDFQPFAVDCGYDGPPFRWDEERRFELRCELDAAFFHLYLGTGEWKQAAGEPAADFARLTEAFPTPQHAVAYVMDTFPLVRKADEEKHGRYRTRERILELYDALAEAVRTGKPYTTRLDPPAADPRVAHPAKTS